MRHQASEGWSFQGHFFLARSAASRAAMFRAAVIRWMTLMTDLSKAMGAVIQRPMWKSPTDPTVGATVYAENEPEGPRL